MAEATIRPALVVVDVQNCFVSPGGSFDQLGYDVTPYQRVVPKVVEAIGRARAAQIPALFSKAIRERSGVDMLDRVHKLLPHRRRERIRSVPISVRDTWDAEIVDDVPVTDDDLIVEKRRDSIFQDTEFELWLRSLGVDTLLFCGVDMIICVECSLRDGFNRGWDVVLVEDATASLGEDQAAMVREIVRDTYGPVLPLDELFKRIVPVEGDEGAFVLAY